MVSFSNITQSRHQITTSNFQVAVFPNLLDTYLVSTRSKHIKPTFIPVDMRAYNIGRFNKVDGELFEYIPKLSPNYNFKFSTSGFFQPSRHIPRFYPFQAYYTDIHLQTCVRIISEGSTKQMVSKLFRCSICVLRRTTYNA